MLSPAHQVARLLVTRLRAAHLTYAAQHSANELDGFCFERLTAPSAVSYHMLQQLQLEYAGERKAAEI